MKLKDWVSFFYPLYEICLVGEKRNTVGTDQLEKAFW